MLQHTGTMYATIFKTKRFKNMKNFFKDLSLPCKRDIKKVLLMTKLTFFLSVFLVLQMSASVYSQTRLTVDSKNKTVKVNCQTLANITITIGDNGSLNDDIFEVRIDGETILTSSSPVRSVSTTIQIPIEDTWVQMIGRAAPDGIGTYYIRFSGASVIGGDHTSGYDLTPGKVKNFFIRPTN